jgi:hypothetical protein
MDRVAPVLFTAGCRQFFVAHLDEGINLRALLPEAEIHVLGGLMPGLEHDFLAHRLSPTLNSLADRATGSPPTCTSTRACGASACRPTSSTGWPASRSGWP